MGMFIKALLSARCEQLLRGIRSRFCVAKLQPQEGPYAHPAEDALQEHTTTIDTNILLSSCDGDGSSSRIQCSKL